MKIVSRVTVILIITVLILMLGCKGENKSDLQNAQNWTHYVRTAGHGLSLERVEGIIKSVQETHVFGIETDNDIPGRYESFLDPTEKLAAIKAIADAAHAINNYAYVYIAGLECITANADKTPHSFFKDHPDWVQRKITGEPAIFGGGTAFWISEGDEDVWISPYAEEWRKIYMERVRQIAGTGIDGVYVDIPYWMTHFDGWEDSWASFDDYTVEAFRKLTGLNAKKDLKLGDFSDANFRKWVDFRIETLTNFMKEIDENVKSVNPNCMTIAEIYPGIGESAVRVGADVYDMYPVVDVIAHEYSAGGYTAAARNPLAWMDYMIGMYTFRSFADGKASWMLSYSWDGDKSIRPADAMDNLSMSQVMAGTNFWDARGHVMSGSNDMDARKVIFKWIADHEKILYLPRKPIQPVGIYFSPKTRDYFADTFFRSYNGFMQFLLQSHLEFEIVTPRTLQNFTGDVLILPDVKCISNDEISFLDGYLKAGKKLWITGETGMYDLSGAKNPVNPLAGLLGIKDLNKEESSSGAKNFIFDPQFPGKNYMSALRGNYDNFAWEGKTEGVDFIKIQEELSDQLIRTLNYQSGVKVQASPFVSTQIARVDGKIHVFFANFKGLQGRKNANQKPETGVKVSFPAKTDSKIYFLPFLGEVQQISGEYKDGNMTCTLPPIERGAIVWVE